MNNVLSIILLFVLLVFSSCNKQTELEELNFGSGEFEEPFRGFLSSRPEVLVKTLDWPIFSSLRSDTVTYSKIIELDFNEEAIRSRSKCRLYFVDDNLCMSRYTKVYFNEKCVGTHGYVVRATQKPQQIKITVKVDPNVGDSVLNGSIAICSSEFDEVCGVSLNGTNIQQLNKWTITHKIGWPLLIWLLWLLILLLILVLACCLIYGLICLLGFLGELLSAISLPSFQRIIKEKRKKEKKKKKNMKKKCPCCKNLKPYCDVLLSNASISKKCKKLIDLSDWWDSHSNNDKDRLYSLICPELKAILDRYWAINKPVPTENGHWIGEKGNGVFYFDSNYHPAEKNTRNGMDWGQLVKEYKKDFNLKVDGGVKYTSSRIDLRDYAVASVKIKYEDSDLSKLRSRGGSVDSIQEIAAKEFEKIMKNEIKKGGYYDFWEYKDGIHNGSFVRNTPLVIHEDYDGETLYLVPKYLHDNWKHYGGVALVSAIIEA